MEKDKLIRGEWKQTDSGRRARFYTLTASGRKRLEQAQTNWATVSKGVQKVLRFV